MTADGFAPFGTVLTAPGQERAGGRAGGRAGPVPVLHNGRPGAPTTLALSWLALPGPITMLERHTHSGQCFLPMAGGTMLVVVAPNGPASACAFVTAPRQGFDLHPGVWHAGVASIGGPTLAAVLLCRDGSSGDMETVSLTDPWEVALP